jgi:D-3-phosphoglycerate dehydrogenase
VLERSDRCKVVARFGVGLDNIPVEAATRLGIPVTYLPDYCVSEVADHTVSMMLALLRGLPTFDRSLKAGRYDPNCVVPRRVGSLTLGLIGFGRIGRAVTARAGSFGMTVVATKRSMEQTATTVPIMALEDVLRVSDVVSLHLPLTPVTHHLIDAHRLSLIKKGGVLINTSRGGLVDSAALLAALDSHRLSRAALDVFEQEPPAEGDLLVSHPRVLATPHVAFRSEESLVELRTRAARQIADALEGKRPEHVVNPEVYQRSHDAKG